MTVQVVVVLPAQAPPVQINDVTADVQPAVSVVVPPELIGFVDAVNAHDGGFMSGVITNAVTGRKDGAGYPLAS